MNIEALNLLDQIRTKLPGNSIMLLGFSDRWAVASQMQSAGTVEIEAYYGFGITPIDAILTAYENVVLGKAEEVEYV